MTFVHTTVRVRAGDWVDGGAGSLTPLMETVEEYAKETRKALESGYYDTQTELATASFTCSVPSTCADEQPGGTECGGTECTAGTSFATYVAGDVPYSLPAYAAAGYKASTTSAAIKWPSAEEKASQDGSRFDSAFECYAKAAGTTMVRVASKEWTSDKVGYLYYGA